jgi:hypothetical protein
MFGQFVLKDEVKANSSARISIIRNAWGKNVNYNT